MKIHHIGYLVRNIKKAQQMFRELGFKECSEQFNDEFRRIYIIFMENDGYTVELISPSKDNSIVSKLINKFINSPYHICYESFDIINDIKSLKNNGFIKIADFMPAIALNNKKVAFFIHPHIGMIEVIDSLS